MTREDIALLLADGARGPYGLDPVRLMKGCFLVAERGPESWREQFHFQPYDYGPFDVSVYAARDWLVSEGLLEVDRASRYERYSVSEGGRSRIEELEEDYGPPACDWLRSVGQYVSSKSFARLLGDIYEAYPQYATRSVLTRR